MSHSPRRRSPFTLARVGGAVTLLAWLVQGTAPRPPLEPLPPTEPAEDVPPVWVVDVSQDSTPPPSGGRRVSGALLRGQRRVGKDGTCGDEDFTPIGLGCWALMGKLPKPPPELCGKYYEHNGRCYGPVPESVKLPTSVTP